MAYIITTDGTHVPVDIGARGMSLQQMQTAVGGYIEVVTLGGTVRAREVLIVNDDGRRLQLPRNEEATRLYQGVPPRHSEFIVGDAIRARIIDGGEDTERVV